MASSPTSCSRSTTAKSPVFLDNQIKTCGGCHEEHLKTYLKSVHGQGLEKLGLMVVPACADCHGAHGVYRAVDSRSTLNVAHVADTCGKCHRYIKERLEASIHGGADGDGRTGQAKRPRRHRPAEAKLHLVPPEARHFGRRVRPVPPGDAPSLRQLSRQPFQPLRDEHSRPADRVGLWPRREVLRLPRRPRDPAGRRSAVVGLGGESGEDVPRVPSAHDGQFPRLRSARRPHRREAQPAGPRRLRRALDAALDDVRLLRAALAVVVDSRPCRGLSARPAARPSPRRDRLPPLPQVPPPRAQRPLDGVPRAGLDRAAAEVQPHGVGEKLWRRPWAGSPRPASGTASAPWSPSPASSSTSSASASSSARSGSAAARSSA